MTGGRDPCACGSRLPGTGCPGCGTGRSPPPVAADEALLGLRLHRSAGDVVMYRALPATAGTGALRMHAD